MSSSAPPPKDEDKDKKNDKKSEKKGEDITYLSQLSRVIDEGTHLTPDTKSIVLSFVLPAGLPLKELKEKDILDIEKVQALIDQYNKGEADDRDIFELTQELVGENSRYAVEIALDFLKQQQSEYNVNTTFFSDTPEGPVFTTDHMTLLLRAAHDDCNSVAKLLVARGADADILRSAYPYGSPVSQACEHGNIEMIKFYLQYTTKSAANDYLTGCVKGSAVDALKLVIKHGYGEPENAAIALNDKFIRERGRDVQVEPNQLKCMKLLIYCCLPFIRIKPSSSYHLLNRAKDYVGLGSSASTRDADKTLELLNVFFEEFPDKHKKLYGILKKSKEILKAQNIQDSKVDFTTKVDRFLHDKHDLAQRIISILKVHLETKDIKSFGETKTKSPAVFSATMNLKSELCMLLDTLEKNKKLDAIAIANLLEKIEPAVIKQGSDELAAAFIAAQSLTWSTISITAMFRLIGRPVPEVEAPKHKEPDRKR